MVSNAVASLAMYLSLPGSVSRNSNTKVATHSMSRPCICSLVGGMLRVLAMDYFILRDRKSDFLALRSLQV
ncbi:hypothetical protein E2C01_028195 [Portunus trituberculatus]|uniref:Uncharacterized protein n=1 Tax=Portunus trituberculatus TaxID=210409 RepID=A0A5B7EQY9_PORTR|nr:hypothetical protein [Portunus trituberculatus]